MLSMSSDTIESYGSREIGHVEYSRSSTPDSSASSRLAAQLERSAYRRSRSKTRRKQNSKQNDVDFVDVIARKSSRNKRFKHQARSHSCEQDQFYTSRMNGTQNPSIRRPQTSDDEEVRGKRVMRKSTEHFSKERHFDEHEDILTAQPVSASYTVSCVTQRPDDHYRVEKNSRRSESTAVQGIRGQPRMDLTQSVINGNSSDRTNGFPSSNRKVLADSQHVYDNRKNISRVRFEESWDDNRPGKKSKVRETSGVTVREETPGYKRSEIHRVTNGDIVESRVNTDTNVNTSSIVDGPIKDNKGKTSVQEKHQGTKTNKEGMIYIKDNFTSRHDVPSRLDTPQARSEITQPQEFKPLGLRQLIKIHEIQIAEVAKSAASMKRPLSGKAHEGRLVKVKIVPEIETKQSHVKQSAKVTFTGNKTNSDSVSALPRKIPEVRSNVVEQASGKENLKNETSIIKARTSVKPKRHTVELRTKPHNQGDQKWKRHTAIGLVGFDHQEHEVPHSEWSPREKKLFMSDSDAEVGYLRKQPVEAEKQFVDEKIQKSDVTDFETPNNEMNKLWKESDEEKHDRDSNEVPPERPPLPKNFYSSTEEILVRPPPPVYKDEPTLDFKKKVEYIATVDFKPNIEYIEASPLSEQPCPLSSSLPAIHVSTAIIQTNGALEQEHIEEKDHVLGKSRTTREMYEERLARINLVPLNVSERHLTNQVTSLCSSVESFAWDTSCNLQNLDKTEYLDKLKTCMKQMKVLTKQKEDVEKNFELERRDWKRKYEEQQKVANAYQKLEDRYRRQVQQLQEALRLCRCADTDTRKALFLGQSWKRTDPYLLTTQTQSILDETEEWLKAQSTRSDITYNSENISNARIPNGHSPHDSLTDIVGTKWVMDYKDILLTSAIDQYNGTSV